MILKFSVIFYLFTWVTWVSALTPLNLWITYSPFLFFIFFYIKFCPFKTYLFCIDVVQTFTHYMFTIIDGFHNLGALKGFVAEREAFAQFVLCNKGIKLRAANSSGTLRWCASRNDIMRRDKFLVAWKCWKASISATRCAYSIDCIPKALYRQVLRSKPWKFWKDLGYGVWGIEWRWMKLVLNIISLLPSFLCNTTYVTLKACYQDASP